MPNVSVPLLTHLTALFYKMTSSGFWIGVPMETSFQHFQVIVCSCFFSYGTPISPASSYCMGDQYIVALDCLRDLGVLISDDLSWSAHYDLLCSRAYKILGLLRRVFNNVFAIAAKKRLYISLVRSQLTYCSVVWRPHLIKDITTLEKIQRRASKYILSDFSSDYKSRLTSLNLTCYP